MGFGFRLWSMRLAALRHGLPGRRSSTVAPTSIAVHPEVVGTERGRPARSQRGAHGSCCGRGRPRSTTATASGPERRPSLRYEPTGYRRLPACCIADCQSAQPSADRLTPESQVSNPPASSCVGGLAIGSRPAKCNVAVGQIGNLSRNQSKQESRRSCGGAHLRFFRSRFRLSLERGHSCPLGARTQHRSGQECPRSEKSQTRTCGVNSC
jgi:hypothetical protein